MSIFERIKDNEASQDDQDELKLTSDLTIPLTQFIDDFGDGLFDAIARQNPPVYQGKRVVERDNVLNALKRTPFEAQREVVHAVSQLLIEQAEPAAILNCDMGTGKTMMAICIASVLQAEGFEKTLVLSPPHLVYKWRREILDTVPNATVWILNGPDTLAKLLRLRSLLGAQPAGPEFFILGRVRMRMGFHWRPAFRQTKRFSLERLESNNENSRKAVFRQDIAVCPDCDTVIADDEGNPVDPTVFSQSDKRKQCKVCGGALWTLMRPRARKSKRDLVSATIQQLPTLGPKTTSKLIDAFGEDLLGDMLCDNTYEFLNLMDEKGNFVFNDRQAKRIERALAKLEVTFGEGGYQPTEFIKRYLPAGTFDLLIVDEGHEYKSGDSAQGQAMGVLATQVKKTVLLTGTLMAGYADDLFYLLWRCLTSRMLEDGYQYNSRGTLGSAAMAFMRDHGVLKDVLKETEGSNHRTAKGKRLSIRTTKAPGFGPKGIARFVLPYTAFLKLKDIGQNVLPSYTEDFIEVDMTPEMEQIYTKMSRSLTDELKRALALGDTSLLGVVLNAVLSWPDCCFRPEVIKHPHRKDTLHLNAALFGENDLMPKEAELLKIIKGEISEGRKVLVYSVYTGKRDTTARLKEILTKRGIKTAVLKSTVGTDKREDWIADQLERGCEVLITNPELVKTGLDLLDFPTIVFLQTGYNVYTLLQASRRSWRIGQKNAVKVLFLGYANTAQISCLSLMAKKIAVTQSTSGEVPESGLEVLNSEGDSIEIALAKSLIAA